METQNLILNYLKNHANSSSKEIFEGLNSVVSYATIKRSLSKLLSEKYITQQGNSKNIRYALSPTFIHSSVFRRQQACSENYGKRASVRQQTLSNFVPHSRYYWLQKGNAVVLWAKQHIGIQTNFYKSIQICGGRLFLKNKVSTKN